MSSPRSLGEPVLSIEPVVGWRAWRLSLRGGTVRLRPLGRHQRPWRPARVTKASCGRRCFHRSPFARCRCGLHIAKDPALLERAPSPAVIGTAALWGQVIEHELGYRGEFGYPQRLRLICSECFRWARSVGTSPDVVAVLPRGVAVPVCEAHLAIADECGLPIRFLRGAHEIESRMLSTYRVDLLPDETTDRPEQTRRHLRTAARDMSPR